MKNNWTNVLLAVLLAFELATGLFGLVSGGADRGFLLVLHNIGAFAIVAIAGWKVAIVAGSLRRRSGGAARLASVTLSFLVLAAFGLGLAWSLNGFFRLAGITGLTWHMFAGVAALPIAAWHALKYTKRWRVGVNADRRAVIKLGGAVAAGAGIWLVYEGLLKQFDLAGASRRFTGSHEYSGGGANAFPTTSWLNDSPGPVNINSWKLRVDGNVSHPFELAIDDIAKLPSGSITATLDCTGGWYANRSWRGVWVSDLLEMANLKEGARSVTFGSVTGYYRRASLEESRNYLLATHVGEEPISHGHGAPIRLVAPGRRGFEWVKWVNSVTVNDTSKWRQPPLPLQ